MSTTATTSLTAAMAGYTPFYRRLVAASAGNLSMRAALHALPQMAGIITGLEQVQAATTALRSTPRSGHAIKEQLTADVLDAVRSGDPVPADLMDQAAAIDTADKARDHALAIVTAAGQGLTADFDQAVRAGGDTMRAALHTELQAMVKAAAKAGPALGALDAASAIASGQVDTYQQALVLGRKYKALRDAQRAIDAELIGLDNLPGYTPASTIANTLDLFEHYPHWASGRKIENAEGYKVDPRPPWPIADPADDGAPLAELVWLATSDAKAWVPSEDQLRGEVERLRASRQAVFNEAAKANSLRMAKGA